MDQDQNALSPTALVWDLNGELCAQEFHGLLARLLAQEANSLQQEVTLRSRG